MQFSTYVFLAAGLSFALLAQSTGAAETVTLVAGNHEASLPTGGEDERQASWEFGAMERGRATLKDCTQTSESEAECKHNYKGPEHGCGTFNDVTLTLYPNGRLTMVDKRCYGFSLTKSSDGTWSGKADWGGAYRGLPL